MRHPLDRSDPAPDPRGRAALSAPAVPVVPAAGPISDGVPEASPQERYDAALLDALNPVSYTHLTLPTICSV